MSHDPELTRRLLDLAIKTHVIDGCLRADGWVLLYLKEHSFRLTEGQLLAFLQGAVGHLYFPERLAGAVSGAA